MDCGAVALAMVLGHHGRETAVAECREALGVGRDGATALGIVKAARLQGLTARAYSVEAADFGLVPLPAIAHWNFNHFVVVERWTPGAVDIVDPAAGRRRVDAGEFGGSFTGVVLAMEPGPAFEPRRLPGHGQRLGALARMLTAPGIGWTVAQVVAATLLLQLLGLALPLFSKVVVDGVLPFRAQGIMEVLGAAMAVLVLAQLVTGYLRATLLVHVQGRLDSRLMLGFFEHLLALPYTFFKQRSNGDLLSRLSSNLVVRETLTGETVSVVLDGGLVLLYLLLLFGIAPGFAATVLVIGVLQVAPTLLTTRRMHRLMERELAAHGASYGYSVEALEGIAVLKASGAEGRAMERWSELFHRQLDVTLQRSHLSSRVDAALLALRTAAPLALLWVGAAAVLDGTMTLGTMLALNAIAIAFLMPLGSLVQSGQRLQLVKAHLDRILDVLEAEREERPDAAHPAPRLAGRIEIRDVGFRYSAQGPWVLKGVSLEVEPGQKVALVGRTGSGKSTLASLLVQLHVPTEGEILYDGMSCRGAQLRDFRGQFGVVLQEPFLFSGSVRENIAFHVPDLPLERVARVAALAEIHDDVARMPMGFETLIAEGGASLSGGQRQRLALARALAHEPAILLLDEATSHLDAVTEARVDRHLSALRCTRIVIAHRLSTVRNADLILVMDGGRIVERGTHAELLARGGLYASLINGDELGEARTQSQPRGDTARPRRVAVPSVVSD